MPTRKPTASSDSARYAPWDVVIVPFPYADKLAEKRRPALVVSKPALEKDHGLIWLAMITSAENRGWTGDVPIADLKRAGLPAPSLVRAAKIATVESSHILKRVGTLSAAERRGVAQAMGRYSAAG